MKSFRIPPLGKNIPDIDIAVAESALGLAVQHFPQDGIRDFEPAFHYHDNIELNFVERGAVTYLHSNRVYEIPEGKLGVFWAGYPHKIFSGDDHLSMWWITIPLVNFTSWNFSRLFYRRLMQGELIIEQESMPELDAALIRQWAGEVGDRKRQPVVLLELEARLRRFELRMQPRVERPLEVSSPNLQTLHPATVKVASYLLKNFQQPLTLERISRQVKLNPSYVNRLFKQHFGCTPGQFLREVRISHAIGLLRNTDDKVLDIAFASGFQSNSRFYSAFQAVTGKRPGDYRSMHRTGEGG